MSRAAEPTEQQIPSENRQSEEPVNRVVEELSSPEEKCNEREEEREQEEVKVEVEVNEDIKEKVREAEALQLIRERREARLARQERTRARLAELTKRMAEKHMLRQRWLPAKIANPVRAFYTRYGYFKNLTEAALFTLGVASLFIGVSLGLWWRHAA